MWKNSTIFFSGYSPGNFKYGDQASKNSWWINHLINSYTDKNTFILFAGVHYPYGLERNFLYSFGEDKEVIDELAEQSRDETDLYHKLKRTGITDIVINQNILNPNRKTTWPVPPLKQSVNELIIKFFSKYTEPVFHTPERNITWRHMTGSSQAPKVKPSLKDAYRFPHVFLEEATTLLREGKLKEAESLFKIASKAPMRPQIKRNIFGVLGNLNYGYKKYDAAKYYYEELIRINPKDYVTLNNLGSIYYSLGQIPQAMEYYKKALHFNPNYSVAQENLRELN